MIKVLEKRKINTDKDTTFQLALKDVTQGFALFIPVITVLMLVLVFMWITNMNGDRTAVYGIWYFISYLFLGIVSLAELYVFRKYKPGNEEDEKILDQAQTIYAWCVPIWSVVVTMLDAIQHASTFGFFNYVVCSMLIIAICYVHTSRWTLIQIVSGIFMVISYVIYGGDNVTIDCLEIIVLVLIFSLSGNLVYNMKLGGYKKQEKLQDMAIAQEKFAVIDGLTGLMNRRAYQMDFEQLEREELSSDFTIVVMDLNGLKQINDNYGHVEGDSVIKESARILEESFGKYGVVYRMGGDEFYMLLFINDEQMKNCKEKMEDMCREWNETHMIKIHMASGQASKKEYPRYLLSEIEKVADNNMYKDKAYFYSQPGHERRRNHYQPDAKKEPEAQAKGE